MTMPLSTPILAEMLCEARGVIDRQENRIASLHAQNKRMILALEGLRDCDWVISLPDRMDAVRKIASDALMPNVPAQPRREADTQNQ